MSCCYWLLLAPDNVALILCMYECVYVFVTTTSMPYEFIKLTLLCVCMSKCIVYSFNRHHSVIFPSFLQPFIYQQSFRFYATTCCHHPIHPPASSTWIHTKQHTVQFNRMNLYFVIKTKSFSFCFSSSILNVYRWIDDIELIFVPVCE